ncbi:exosporium glycoprotein BclB-related protein [Parageobacillus toebii]|uniref:exosporium glycoprotein BclB-related protein n=1 Tax=Parageobacillus toebii TaxID=153151 RepID=UPI0035B54D69
MSKDWGEKCKDHHKPKIRCGCINGQAVTVNGPATPGPPGPPGPPGAGAIIPYASGTTPVALATVAGGLVGTGAIVGFGSSAPTASLSAGTLTLGVGVGNIPDFAFVVPRTGTVTSISAFFSATVGVTLGAAGTVRAELWIAPALSNTFTPTGVFVDLAPAFGPVVAIGATAAGTAAAALPVAAGDKLLLVFSLTAPGSTAISTLTGFASAGVGIS